MIKGFVSSRATSGNHRILKTKAIFVLNCGSCGQMPFVKIEKTACFLHEYLLLIQNCSICPSLHIVIICDDFFDKSFLRIGKKFIFAL